MESTKTIQIAVRGASTVALDALEPFQDDLKHIEKTEYEKLRKAIIEQGFSFSVHVWQSEGHNYIIDGHQRVFVLKHMKETEGWEVPEIPVSFVEAADYQEAKKKVLAGASAYGKMNQAGLIDYMKTNDISFDLVASTFDFPDIDLMAVSEALDMSGPEIEMIDEAPPEMKSGSVGVKQVQLFFNAESHAEFMNKIDELSKSYGKENITDAVLECVREVYKVRQATPR